MLLKGEHSDLGLHSLLATLMYEILGHLPYITAQDKRQYPYNIFLFLNVNGAIDTH